MSHLLRRILRMNAPRKDLKYCDCGTANEPERTTCIGCGKRF